MRHESLHCQPAAEAPGLGWQAQVYLCFELLRMQLAAQVLQEAHAAECCSAALRLLLTARPPVARTHFTRQCAVCPGSKMWEGTCVSQNCAFALILQMIPGRRSWLALVVALALAATATGTSRDAGQTRRHRAHTERLGRRRLQQGCSSDRGCLTVNPSSPPSLYDELAATCAELAMLTYSLKQVRRLAPRPPDQSSAVGKASAPTPPPTSR